MSGRLKVEQALEALPELDELTPIRAALIGASDAEAGLRWSSSEVYRTLDTRVADTGRLESQLGELVAGEGRRLGALYGHVAAALRALEARDLAGAAAALVAAGEVEEGAERLEAAAHFYRRGLELGRRPRDRRVEGQAMRRLGRIAKRRGRLDEALQWYRNGYEVAAAQRDGEGVVVACQGMGNVYVDQGRWGPAGEWYERGLEAYRPELPAQLLWQLQVNLSIVTRRTGDLRASRLWLGRARETGERLGEVEAAVFVRNAEGLLRVAEGDLPGAERVYREAMEAGGAPASRATVLINLAECLLAMGRIADSERVARELERLAVANRLLPFLPHVYRALGAVARERQDENGFLFYEQALALTPAGDAGMAYERALTQEEYGGFEARLKQLESAAARLAEAEELLRSLGAQADVERVVAERRDLLGRMEAGEAGGDG